MRFNEGDGNPFLFRNRVIGALLAFFLETEKGPT